MILSLQLLSMKMRSDDMVGQVKYLLLLGALYYETGHLVKAKDCYTRVCLSLCIL